MMMLMYREYSRFWIIYSVSVQWYTIIPRWAYSLVFFRESITYGFGRDRYSRRFYLPINLNLHQILNGKMEKFDF
jgi:hypothetical protein